MRNITVKNIPNDLYEQLTRSAKINRRSINQEIIICIESSVRSKNIDRQELIENARIMRQRTVNQPINNQELNRLKGLKRF